MNHIQDSPAGGKPLWGRIVSMLVLGFSYAVAEAVLVAMVIGQLLFLIFGKKQNEPLKRVGQQVSAYIYQILLFLTFNTEHRPFPYQGWGEDGGTLVIVPDRDQP